MTIKKKKTNIRHISSKLHSVFLIFYFYYRGPVLFDRNVTNGTIAFSFQIEMNLE